jgi:hypothetical protein
MGSQRSPSQDHREQKENKTEISQPNVNSLAVGNARLTIGSAPNVFFGGKHWLKM